MPLQLITPQETRTVPHSPDRRLDELALDQSIPLDRRCGGQGVCQRCRVLLGPGKYRINGHHTTVPPGEKLEALSCQTFVLSPDAIVTFPVGSLVEKKAQIGDDFMTGDFTFGARTRRVCVIVPPATEACPLPDRDRLAAALTAKTGLTGFEFPLFTLQQLSSLLNGEPREYTVTLSHFKGRWEVTGVDVGDLADDPNLAVVVDIGTTTVVCALVDLNTGAVLGKASRYNQQIVMADDVASRISLCANIANLEKLHRLVVEETINPLIKELCHKTGSHQEQITRLVAAGNTVMTHLFLNCSPWHIGRIPFQPVTHVHDPYRAGELGVLIHPLGLVDVVPSISGYIGGDITADLYVAKPATRPGVTLLVDIGTNGEMVLSAHGKMTAAATAAGPAFEGAGIRHGCRAAEGAIERVEFDEHLRFQLAVIGQTRPTGLCGSAIIDFIALLRRHDWLSPTGRYDLAQLKEHNCYLQVEEGPHPVHACLLVPAEASGSGEPLYVTEQDVAEILKAKAAIYAGMRTLLTHRGMNFTDLDRLILAGGFARYINPVHAMEIGLLPQLAEEQIEVIGNGSLAGAYLAAVDENAFQGFHELITAPETVSLNRQPDFEDHYIDALLLD